MEELALQHYASAAGGSWQGLHTEGGVWMTLFGLLMWDILFAGNHAGMLALQARHNTCMPQRLPQMIV